MRTRRLLVLAILMLAAVPAQLQAEQIFDFSFTNTIGNVAGTVTGQIVLPFDGDHAGAATNVIIDRFPPALSSVGTPPIDARSWGYQEANMFTVSSGQVTGASAFYAYTSTSYPSSVLYLSATTSYLAYGAGPLTHGAENEVYSDTTSFVPAPLAPAPSPEPPAVTLLFTGLLAAGGFRAWSAVTFHPTRAAAYWDQTA